MSLLNLTIGDVFNRISKQFRRNETDYFELPDLSPWKGRRAQVYPIIAACWRAGIHNYKAIQKQVKLETGTACSRATIADWKREYLPKPKPEKSYPTPLPPSPRTGTGKGIFREGVVAKW